MNITKNKMYVLPEKALLMINEYSKPMTRPDWRKCKRMTQRILFIELVNLTQNTHSTELNIFDTVIEYMKKTDFYIVFMLELAFY
jgi:hypothetical protein